MAQSKGSIYISLEIDDKGTPTIKKVSNEYDAAMKKMAASTNSASRTASAGFDRMKSGMASLRMSWLALTAAVTGFLYTAKKMIDAYLEQERAEIQLANAMKLAGNYTEQNFKRMVDYASSLQLVTRYGDETILRMMNLLQTYRLNTQETKWATQAALDFASATGMDAESAARYLGMGLKGNIEMLARYIPALKSTTNEQLKTMSATEKATYLIQAFNEQFAGRAQAEMQSYGAQLDQLRNIMGEISETVGKSLVQSLIITQSATGDTTEAFRKFAQVGAQAAYIVSIAFKTLIDVIRGLRAAFDLVIYSIQKVQEWSLKLEIASLKAAITMAKITGNVENQRDAMLLLRSAQEQLVETLQKSETTAEDYNEQQRIIQEGNEALEQAFADLDTMIAGYGETIVATGNKMGKFALSAKDAAKAITSVMSTELTDEMKSALKEYEDASKEVSDRIKELSLSEYDYKIYLLDEHMKALRTAGIDETKLAELYNLEKQKIYDDAIEKQKESNEKLIETASGAAGELRDTFKEIFLEASADDFDNWIDRIGNKLNNFIADMVAAFAVDMWSGGKMFNFGSLFGGGGGTPAGMEGPLLETGQFYSSTNLFDKAVDFFGSGVDKFVNGFGPAGLGPAGITLAIAKGLASFAPSSMQGKSGFSGYGKGFEEGWNTPTGPMKPLVGAVGATFGLLGFHPFAGSDAEHQEAIMKRAQEFYDEYEKLLNTHYDSLTKMLDDFNYLMSARHIEALEELGHINGEVAGAFHATAQALKALNLEASKGMGASVESFRRLETVMTKTAMIAPEMSDRIMGLFDKMKGLLEEDIFGDFEDGLLGIEEAVKKLMRLGMSQLDAQTKLLGSDYAELVTIINGSIPALDKTADAFNDVYDALDEFDETIKSLPDSLNRLKKQLALVSYEIRYLANMSQSFITLKDDWDDFASSVREMSDALKAGDLERVAKELYDMQQYALEAASAFSQLASAVRYLGNRELANNIGRIAAGLAGLAGLIGLISALYQISQAIKEIGQDSKDMFDKWALWEDQVKDAKIADVISSITEKAREWEDIIGRSNFGNVVGDMQGIVAEFSQSVIEIQRLADDLGTDVAYPAYLLAVEAYTEQIRDYFDEVLKGFTELSDQITRNMQELSPEGRTSENVTADIIKAGMELGALDVLKDPDAFLNKAQELQNLVLERYEIERQGIEEQISAQQEIKAAYEALFDTANNALLSIQGGGLNPQTAQERLTYFEQEATRLRTSIASETDPIKRAALQSELVSVLTQYLQAAEDVYQRPSDAYQAIYQSVVSELTALRTDAQTQISEADAQLITLNTQMTTLQQATIDQLGLIKTATDNAGIDLANLRDAYIATIQGDISGLKESLETGLPIGFADIGGKITETTTAVTTLSTTLIPVMNTQVTLLAFIQSGIERVISAIIGLGFLGALIPHQAGIDYVPRDNYPAMLHRGEAVVRSRENRGGNVNVTVNATVNNASNARQFVDELKKEIKWGSLGNTIENRVRKIA